MQVRGHKNTHALSYGHSKSVAVTNNTRHILDKHLKKSMLNKKNHSCN